MRFNPIIVELNKIIKSKKNLFIENGCTSYFPSVGEKVIIVNLTLQSLMEEVSLGS